MSLNMAIIVGRAGRDAESKTTSGGSALCTVSLATDYWKGKGQKTTEWHNVVAWGNQAEALEKVRKGDNVMVVGRLQTREYQTSSGETRRSTEIVANKVSVLVVRADEPRRENDGGSNHVAGGTNEMGDEYDGGLPF